MYADILEVSKARPKLPNAVIKAINLHKLPTTGRVKLDPGLENLLKETLEAVKKTKKRGALTNTQIRAPTINKRNTGPNTSVVPVNPLAGDTSCIGSTCTNKTLDGRDENLTANPVITPKGPMDPKYNVNSYAVTSLGEVFGHPKKLYMYAADARRYDAPDDHLLIINGQEIGTLANAAPVRLPTISTDGTCDDGTTKHDLSQALARMSTGDYTQMVVSQDLQDKAFSNKSPFK